MSGDNLYNLQSYIELLKRKDDLLAIDEEADKPTRCKVDEKFHRIIPTRWQ